MEVKNNSSAAPHFDFKRGRVLPGHLSDYAIEKFLGQGSFGNVVRCRKLKTNEVVAVKVVRKNFVGGGKKEAKELEKLRKLDPDRNNLIKFDEHFMYQGHFCLVFEKLDMSLLDFMEMRNFAPLFLCQIRPIAQQLLSALKALRSIRLIHADIKPDNIMLVSHKSQPFKVKLIDFGLATDTQSVHQNGIVQNVAYRAPEVLLKHPNLDEAVDMWPLGCVLAFLYLGHHLYPFKEEYLAMRTIVQMNGKPDNEFLNAAAKTRCFFNLVKEKPRSVWWLKSSQQYLLERGLKVQNKWFPSPPVHSLDLLLEKQKWKAVPCIFEDTLEFISLLKQMLHVDPRQRITPEAALKHNFVTMEELPLHLNDPYLNISKQMMAVCSADMGSCISPESITAPATSEKLPVSDKADEAKFKKELTSTKTGPKEPQDRSQTSTVQNETENGGFHAEEKKSVTKEQQDTSDTLAVNRTTLEDRSSKQEVPSLPVTVAVQDSSGTWTNRSGSNEMNPNDQGGTSSPRRETEDLDSKTQTDANETCDAGNSEEEITSAPVGETDHQQQEPERNLSEKLSELTPLREDVQDSSEVPTDENGTNEMIPAEEEVKCLPRSETVHRQEEPEMHLSQKRSGGPVKHSKTLFGNIAKFFSRLLKPRHKDNTNEDAQLHQDHMSTTVTEEQQDTSEILSVNDVPVTLSVNDVPVTLSVNDVPVTLSVNDVPVEDRSGEEETDSEAARVTDDHEEKAAASVCENLRKGSKSDAKPFSALCRRIWESFSQCWSCSSGSS